MVESPEQNGFTEFISWEAKSRDTIDFKTIYVDMAGDLMAGLMLSQIIYWYLPDKRGRSKLRVQKHGYMWLVKARDDWWTEIRLTARQADRALKILRDKGLITTSLHRFSGAPTTHIRLNKAAFLVAWNEAVANDYSNLPNGEFTKPLIQEGGNLSNGDMELPDPVNSLTETTAKTTVTKTTILPADAENPPSQPETSDSLPPTENPQSVTNAPPLEVPAPAPSTGDYAEDLLNGQGRGASPTVPPAAGGAGSFGDGPVKAFCILVGLPKGMLPDEKRAAWGRELRRVAALWSDQDEGKIVTASIMIWAFEQWQRANKDRSIGIPGNLGWKKPTPSYLFEHQKNDDRGFSADIGPLLCYGLEHGYIDFPSSDDGSSTTGNLAGMRALAEREGWLDGDP